MYENYDYGTHECIRRTVGSYTDDNELILKSVRRQAINQMKTLNANGC